MKGTNSVGPSATQENGSEPSRTLTTLRPPAGFIRVCQSDTGLDPPDSADSLSPPSLEALGTLLKLMDDMGTSL